MDPDFHCYQVSCSEIESYLQEMLNTVGSVALLAEGRDLKYVTVSSVKKVFKNYVKSDLFLDQRFLDLQKII